MPKNQSEKQTLKLSKNSFLNMYVYSNPNKKNIHTKTSDEFCDCLIHMANTDIVIQIKENNEPNANNWFHRKVLGDARLQLSVACGVICSNDFEIWNRKNTLLISKCGQKPQRVSPVIVFEKKDIDSYPQVVISEKIADTDYRYVPCNIFSMEDFEYVTSMIPTGPDFIDYLKFRYKKLKDHPPVFQLFPLFKKGENIVRVKYAVNNEHIMVAEFLSTKTDEPEKMLINAKMWHDNIVGLENDNRMNPVLLKLLSYFRIENLVSWDQCHKLLVEKSGGINCTWISEPILTGTVDGKKYGIMLSYLPIKDFLMQVITEGDVEMTNDAMQALKDYSLDGLFVFQYTDSKGIRVTSFGFK